MTVKEQVYNIIDGFTEAQLRGFIALFSRDESKEADPDKAEIIKWLAKSYFDKNSDTIFKKHMEETTEKLRAEGESEARAYIYASGFTLYKISSTFKIIINLINYGYTPEKISEFLEMPMNEIEEMINLLRLKYLIE